MRKPLLFLVITTTLSLSFEVSAAKKPKVVTLDVVEITATLPKVKPKKKDPVKCHMEGRVKVCRPDSVAANKVSTRSTAALKRSNRNMNLRSLLGSDPWLLPKRLYRKLTSPPKEEKKDKK